MNKTLTDQQIHDAIKRAEQEVSRMAPFSSMEEHRLAFCRALLAAQQPETPTFEAKHISLKQKGAKLILKLELDGVEGAPRYTVTPINPSVVRPQPEPRAEVTDDEGCTPADARMLRAANHALAAENDALRRALRPFVSIVSTDRLSWAMVEYCVDGDPEKQTFQRPQMQRAFNRAADLLRENVPSETLTDNDEIDAARAGEGQ